MGAELGAVRGTYRTDSRRRARASAIFLLAGVPAILLSVMFWMVMDEVNRKTRISGDPLAIPTILVGLSMGLLVLGGESSVSGTSITGTRSSTCMRTAFGTRGKTAPK